MFGFRPNLTRRPDATRWNIDNDGKRPYQPVESIAHDVALNHTESTTFNKLFEWGIFSLHFLHLACITSEPVAEYLLAASAYHKDTTRLMAETLKTFHQVLGNWGTTDSYNVCEMVFKVLAAIPDERQQERINMLMLNDDKMKNGTSGLMVYGEGLAQQYHQQDYHYGNIIDKYVALIKLLQKQHAVALWMSENRNAWTWMEPEAPPEEMHPLQSRSDRSGHRGGRGNHYQSASSNLQNNSDSDLNGGINDSDDDVLDEDDDSRYEPDMVDHVVVEGCGVPVINGTYKRHGSCDGVPKYCRSAVWNDKEEDFMLFRCKLSDESRRWYISVVPGNVHPGTTKDIDFYWAPANMSSSKLPPQNRWQTIQGQGIQPCPHVYAKPIYQDGDGQGNDVVFVNDRGEPTGYL
jgi:ubiquitin carboxyl-terminal hydrolase 9/24